MFINADGNVRTTNGANFANSSNGNWTHVSRVLGECTYHYTIEPNMRIARLEPTAFRSGVGRATVAPYSLRQQQDLNLRGETPIDF